MHWCRRGLVVARNRRGESNGHAWSRSVRQTTSKVSVLGQRANSNSNFARPFGAREIRLTP